MEAETLTQAKELEKDKAAAEALENVRELLDRVEKLPVVIGLAVLRALFALGGASTAGASGVALSVAESIAHQAEERYMTRLFAPDTAKG